MDIFERFWAVMLIEYKKTMKYVEASWSHFHSNLLIIVYDKDNKCGIWHPFTYTWAYTQFFISNLTPTLALKDAYFPPFWC